MARHTKERHKPTRKNVDTSIEANWGFIVMETTAFAERNPTICRDDIEQEAMIAVWQASLKFDRKLGGWSNFCRQAIRWALLKLIKQPNFTPLPDNFDMPVDEPEVAAIIEEEYDEAVELLTVKERLAITMGGKFKRLVASSSANN